MGRGAERPASEKVGELALVDIGIPAGSETLVEPQLWLLGPEGFDVGAKSRTYL